MTIERKAVKTTWFSIAGNSALAAIKLTNGNLGHSYAVIADAVESTADIFSSFHVLFGIKYTSRHEWATYKIIYVYGTRCKNVEAILKIAVEKSHGDYSDTEKAWMMRAAFDKILRTPTQTNDPEGSSLLKKE